VIESMCSLILLIVELHIVCGGYTIFWITLHHQIRQARAYEPTHVLRTWL
jgi:hypothetical protein